MKPSTQASGASTIAGPLYIEVSSTNLRYLTRAISYVGFSGDGGILVNDQENATTFELMNGFLVTGGEYVGADSSDGQAQFEKYSTQPAVAQGWSSNGTSLSFRNATFCYTSEETLFLIFTSNPALMCQQITLIPAPASTEALPTLSGTTAPASSPVGIGSLSTFLGSSVEQSLASAHSQGQWWLSATTDAAPSGSGSTTITSSPTSTVEVSSTSTAVTLPNSGVLTSLPLSAADSSVETSLTSSSLASSTPSLVASSMSSQEILTPTSAPAPTTTSLRSTLAISSSITSLPTDPSSPLSSSISIAPLSSLSFASSTSAATGCSVTPTIPLCPMAYNHATVSQEGVCYDIECASALQGDNISGNTYTANSLSNCNSLCNLYNLASPYGCVGVNYLNNAQSDNCKLLSTITGLISSPETDSGSLIYAGYMPYTSSGSSPSTTPSSSSISSVMAAPSNTSSLSRTGASSLPTPYERNTGKRGLAYNNVTLTQFYSLSHQNSQVNWAYDYYSLPNASDNAGPTNPALTFVPLLYDDSPSLTSIWSANVADSIANYGADAILAFNEPDACNSGQSACMTVNASVAAYQTFIQPFAGQLLLGGPAVTNQGPPAGLAYLSEFLGNCSGCTIDFIPIHWYASPYNFQYLMDYVNQAYQTGGNRPIWVTEFGMDQAYDDADVQTFLKNATTWFDAQSFVHRYAWFGDFPGNLVNTAGSGLSADGVIWNNYTGGYVLS